MITFYHMCMKNIFFIKSENSFQPHSSQILVPWETIISKAPPMMYYAHNAAHVTRNPVQYPYFTGCITRHPMQYLYFSGCACDREYIGEESAIGKNRTWRTIGNNSTQRAIGNNSTRLFRLECWFNARLATLCHLIKSKFGSKHKAFIRLELRTNRAQMNGKMARIHKIHKWWAWVRMR